jgi:hypothetical protein
LAEVNVSCLTQITKFNTMSRSSEDETQKLSGRSSPDIELSVTDNEQKRGLLSDATKGLGDEAYENRSIMDAA